MIDVHYLQCMARYNRWQNAKLYGAADALSDAERRRDRRAFFGSIHATLNHLLWADRIWMSRLAGTPRPDGGIPESVALYGDWDELKRERKAFDAGEAKAKTKSATLSAPQAARNRTGRHPLSGRQPRPAGASMRLSSRRSETPACSARASCSRFRSSALPKPRC